MLDAIPHAFHSWLLDYGPFALFALLALGIIALPVPEETLMLVSGILIEKGKLHPTGTVLAAWAGCLTGITGSYIIGRTSEGFLIKKWGPRFGITKERMAKFHVWFERFGKWALFFGYFFPGVRHFTGISAGVSKLEYRHFALFAYCGAIVWSSTFLAFGYFFGEYGSEILENIEIDIDSFISLLITLTVIYFLIKMKRKDDHELD